ncbi:MAG TPA: DinB family protein [Candidatus Dormibacteraeota bacterium]
MTGTDVLRLQLDASFNLIQGRLDGLTDEEWNARALPETSKPGFILWHCARTLDWAIHSALQGAPEVADRPRWRDSFPSGALYGAGISDVVADTLAGSVARGDVIEYLGEVRPSVMDWLEGQTDATLDAKVQLRANQQHRQEYLEPSVWAEVASLDGLPAWQFLTRPCISHIRVHMGEIEVLLQAIRSTSGANRT